MKKKTSISLMLAAAAMTAGLSTAQDTPTDTPPTQEQLKEEAAKPVDPAQLKKDISYFLGFQNGRQMSSIPTLKIEDLDMAIFMKALAEGMKGDPCPVPEAQLENSLKQFQTVIDERLAALAKTNLEASKKFMEENGKKEGIVTTDSGLQYKVIEKGGDKKYDEKEYKEPLFTVKYKGTTPEGVVFDDSGDKAVDFPLQLIPGFTEALKAMPIGAKWQIFIPAELAYGEQSPSPKIQPNQALIFDVELQGIKEAPKTSNSPMSLTPEQLQQLMQQQQGGQK